jgi:hypothetical protein
MISTKQYVEGYPGTLDTITKRFGEISYGEALRVLNRLIDEMMP